MKHETPWPERGNPLFEVDTDPAFNVEIGYEMDAFQYFEAYKVAEEGLYDLAVGRDPTDDTGRGYGMYDVRRSQLAVVLVFVARQHLELSMKRLLDISLVDAHDVPTSNPHGLVQLWQASRGVIEETFPDAPAEDLDAVGEQMAQLHDVDPRSDRFRYPSRRDGQQHARSPGEFSLRTFHDRLDELSAFFLTVFVGIEGFE